MGKPSYLLDMRCLLLSLSPLLPGPRVSLLSSPVCFMLRTNFLCLLINMNVCENGTCILSLPSLGSRPECYSCLFIGIFEGKSDWPSGLDMRAALESGAHLGPCGCVCKLKGKGLGRNSPRERPGWGCTPNSTLTRL